MKQALRLSQLEPELLKLGMEDGHRVYLVANMTDAQGIEFLCPVCFLKNGGRVGTHAVICWSKSRGVPDSESPGPGRWTLEGGNLQNLTLGSEPGKSNSVLLKGEGCKAHFFVKNGAIEIC